MDHNVCVRHDCLIFKRIHMQLFHFIYFNTRFTASVKITGFALLSLNIDIV